MNAAAFEPPRVHRVRTPEGISLPFVVAPVGDRLRAFLIDFAILAAASVALWLLAVFSSLGGLDEVGFSLALLGSFLLWNFYFLILETRRGVTIGKRVAGLRVIARGGGPLTAEAVIARNLTRDLEVFLPLSALLAPGQLLPGAPGWATGLSLLWMLVFAGMPLFNKDRLRCGDLVGGTVVVLAPMPVLLGDLADRPERPPRAVPEPAAGLAFTREQLDIYGIRELQVLEDVLRRRAEGTLDGRVLGEVAAKIQAKIGWQRGGVPAPEFLEAFYAAQRRHLEQGLLFGRRRESKRDASGA